MEFNTPKGIYLQIAEQISDRILQAEWAAEERIPSIRELAAEIGVNPNTVTKSYQSLVDRGLIENRRGLGFFVTPNAQQLIRQNMRENFLQREVPVLARRLHLLQLNLNDIEPHLRDALDALENDDET